MATSKELSVVDFIKSCSKSTHAQLAKICQQRRHRRVITDTLRFGVELLHNLENVSDEECGHLQAIQLLMIRLLHNTKMHRSDAITFFREFTQYNYQSKSLSGCIVEHMKTLRNPTLIKILCGCLDVLSHYQLVMNERWNDDDQCDEILQHIRPRLEHPDDHLPYLGSFFFYLGSTRSWNLDINPSSTQQCRQYIIASAEKVDEWSPDTLHHVMGTVVALAIGRSEYYYRALLTIANSRKLQQALLATCTNDETLLIHTITEHLVRAINSKRMEKRLIRKYRRSLRKLYGNTKYSLTKANICYLLLRVASVARHIPDRMLIEYFQCMDKLQQSMRNMEKREEKREQLITGLRKARQPELIKQRVVPLQASGKMVIGDENLKRWLDSVVLPLDAPNEREIADSQSMPVSTRLDLWMTHYNRVYDRRVYAEYRRLDDDINLDIETKYDIVIHCGPTSSPLRMQNHLMAQGHTVFIADKNISDPRGKEKKILQCKSMIAYINDDYEQHRPALIFAYKNQVPIILAIANDSKEPPSDDSFQQFIFTESSLLSNVVFVKDFDQAMNELTNAVKNPRAITKADDRKKDAVSRLKNGPTTEDLYDACRKNDIERVRQYLRQMDNEEINRLAASGSTALHVASYKGHDAIVQLLLQAGASSTIRNRHYHLTAYEEASKSSTKNLFHIHQHRQVLPPFINDNLQMEWTCAYRDPVQQRRELRQKLDQLLSIKDYDYNAIFAEIRKSMDMALTELTYPSRESKIIKKYYQRLERESDPTHFIKCYSSTTSFHRYLNEYLAKNAREFFDPELVNLNTDYRVTKTFLQLIAIVMHHDRFRALRFSGQTYRGLLMSEDDLHKYIVGSKIMNTSFLSTSKENDIARMFSGTEEAAKLRKTHDGHPLQFSVICIYNINDRDTALDIESISERRSDEKEVLILPFSAFEVKGVRKLASNNVEIVLDGLTSENSNELGSLNPSSKT